MKPTICVSLMKLKKAWVLTLHIALPDVLDFFGGGSPTFSW